MRSPFIQSSMSVLLLKPVISLGAAPSYSATIIQSSSELRIRFECHFCFCHAALQEHCSKANSALPWRNCEHMAVGAHTDERPAARSTWPFEPHPHHGAIEVSRTDPLLGQRLFALGCSLIRKDEALERPGFSDVHPVRRAVGRIGAFSINFPSALSVDNRLVMPCADRFRTAPIKTEDRPAALNSSNRRSSISVQNLLYLPGMATIVNLPVSGTGYRAFVSGRYRRFRKTFRRRS